MSKQTIFLVGATGETGRVILDALIEDGSFDITCFIRTSSSEKPAVQALRDRGLKVVTGELTGPISETAALLQGIDTVITIIFPPNLLDQIPFIDACAQAGVKRFIPCDFGTTCARGNILTLKDIKETVHDHVFRAKLPFTIIDVGYWYQLSFPRIPSGKFDYAAAMPANDIHAGGTAKTMLTHKTDVGRITARIVKDPRTLNKKVIAYGQVLSQNEICSIVERKTGEKLELTHKSKEDVYAALKTAREAAKEDPENVVKKYRLLGVEHAVVKFVRADNTPENAEYLGYTNGNDLYPDFKWIKFEEFVDELIEGKVEKPYPALGEALSKK